MIIKRRVSREFVQIENSTIRDKRLSLEAHGLLHYLLSMSDQWEVNQRQLCRYWSIGRDKCRRIFGELRSTGWAKLERMQADDGAFIGARWIIGDEPGEPDTDELAADIADEDDEDSLADAPGAATAPERQAPAVPAQGIHATENPSAGKPVRRETRATEKASDGRINTDQENNLRPNTKPEGLVEGRADDNDGEPPPPFGRLLREWDQNHVNSPFACEQVYNRLVPWQQLLAFRGVRPYLAECRNKSQRICDLKTYLNERRWERFVGEQARVSGPLFVVKRGTPQAARWREHIAQNDPARLKTFDHIMATSGSYTMRSEWPPPRAA